VSESVAATIDSAPGQALVGANTTTLGDTGLDAIDRASIFGVHGSTFSPAGIAVFGENSASAGDPVGVLGRTQSGDRGIGVRGQAVSPNGAAGVFNAIGGGDILVGIGFNAFTTFRVNANGNVFASAYNVGGADFAESLAVAGDRMRYRPGDILVIDATGVSRV